MDKHYVRGLVLDPTMKVSPSRVRRQRDTRERDTERDLRRKFAGRETAG